MLPSFRLRVWPAGRREGSGGWLARASSALSRRLRPDPRPPLAGFGQNISIDLDGSRSPISWTTMVARYESELHCRPMRRLHPQPANRVKCQLKCIEERGMEVTLPPDLRQRVQQELATGHYGSIDELLEQAVRRFLDEARRGQQGRPKSAQVLLNDDAAR